MHAILT